MVISMIVGVLFGMGIFAAKTGLGLYTGMAWMKKRWMIIGLVCALYGFLFYASWRILSLKDMTTWLPHVMGVIEAGTQIHLTMAGFMLAWGLWLLGRKPGTHHKSKGWLMLVLPCPLCMTVIVCTTGMLMSAFPDHAPILTGLLYLVFIVVLLLMFKTVDLVKKYFSVPPETLLGGAMVMLSVYFFVSMTVMPHVAELENIYRLARYQGSVHGDLPEHALIFLGLIIICFLWGFARTTLNLGERRMA